MWAELGREILCDCNNFSHSGFLSGGPWFFFSVLGVFHVKFLCCGDCFLISLISRIFACFGVNVGSNFPIHISDINLHIK